MAEAACGSGPGPEKEPAAPRREQSLVFREPEGGREGGQRVAAEGTAPDRADLSLPWEAFDFVLNAHTSASVDFKQKGMMRTNLLTQRTFTERFDSPDRDTQRSQSLAHSGYLTDASFLPLPRIFPVNSISIELEKYALKK